MQRVSGISKGYVEFVMSILYYFREWQDSLERLLDSGVHCVQCTLQFNSVPPLARINIFPTTPNHPPPFQSPSADNSRSPILKTENILRRM